MAAGSGQRAEGTKEKIRWRLEVGGWRQKILSLYELLPPTSSEGEPVEPERSSNLTPQSVREGYEQC